MREIHHLPTDEKEEECSGSGHLPACMSRAMNLIGDPWTLRIVYELLSNTRRFGELLESMGNVSPKTVSQRLKMLEQKGFVERQAFAEIPPRVEYHLTENGRALADILQAIWEFGQRYLADDDESAGGEKIHAPVANP
jgi:DNA-binding HxlR family transcriptional regulator